MQRNRHTSRVSLSTDQRLRILDRDMHICAYCQGAATVVDHIVPYAFSQNNSDDNLIAACKWCNSHATSFVFDTLQAKRDYLLELRKRKKAPLSVSYDDGGGDEPPKVETPKPPRTAGTLPPTPKAKKAKAPVAPRPPKPPAIAKRTCPICNCEYERKEGTHIPQTCSPTCRRQLAERAKAEAKQAAQEREQARRIAVYGRPKAVPNTPRLIPSRPEDLIKIMQLKEKVTKLETELAEAKRYIGVLQRNIAKICR